MSELNVHASMCEIVGMVQTDEIRTAFVKRLREALAHANIAEWGAGARLAKMADATPKAASRWLNSETMPGRAKMQAIADALNVRVEWLQYGWGQMLHGSTVEMLEEKLYGSNVVEIAQPYREAKEYPLISWVAAGCWEESCDNFNPGDADEWLKSDANAGAHGYWLEVKGPSMLPTFSPGMRILIKPENFDLISGKYYVAKLLDTGETTFKQFLRDGGSSYLQPLNQAFPVIPITENVAIIGMVVDAKLPASLF